MSRHVTKFGICGLGLKQQPQFLDHTDNTLNLEPQTLNPKPEAPTEQGTIQLSKVLAGHGRLPAGQDLKGFRVKGLKGFRVKCLGFRGAQGLGSRV